MYLHRSDVIGKAPAPVLLPKKFQNPATKFVLSSTIISFMDF